MIAKQEPRRWGCFEYGLVVLVVLFAVLVGAMWLTDSTPASWIWVPQPAIPTAPALPPPTQTPQANPVVAESPTPDDSGSPGGSPVSVTSGSWEIETSSGATAQMREWSYQALDPANWPEFPNVDNPLVGFEAKDGLEYGMDESLYCQRDQTCDIVVPAMHYRIISGDYDLGFDSCTGSVAGEGCAIMLVNVGTVSADFREIQIDLGFTVFGRYWNGDEMPLAIWAGLSHVVHNMLNLLPQVGSGEVNRGANCSVPQGCESVRAAFVIMSGNEILVKGVTTVSR